MNMKGSYAEAHAAIASAWAENIGFQLNTKTMMFKPVKKDPETGRTSPVSRASLSKELLAALEESGDAIAKVLAFHKARAQLKKECLGMKPAKAGEIGQETFESLLREVGNETFEAQTREEWLGTLSDIYRKSLNAARKVARGGKVTSLEERRGA